MQLPCANEAETVRIISLNTYNYNLQYFDNELKFSRYYFILFVFGFFVPLLVICWCYWRLESKVNKANDNFRSGQSFQRHQSLRYGQKFIVKILKISSLIFRRKTMSGTPSEKSELGEGSFLFPRGVSLRRYSQSKN